jgi:F-type H+-transporting ATPase subunit epsilon
MAEHAMGVEVVTPESALFRGPATLVVASTSEGDFSVMADHAELIGDVVPGVVRIEADGQDPITILVHGGFVQVTTADGAAAGIVEGVGEGVRSTRVTILAGIAEPAQEIDKPRAERAKAEAEARLAELRSSSNRSADDGAVGDALLDLAQAEADLARAELRLGTSAVLS